MKKHIPSFLFPFLVLTLGLLAVAPPGCSYPATPEGDAKRAHDASTVQTVGDSLAAASAALPPPFNLIAAGLVGMGTTLVVQKIKGKKAPATPPPVA
jgi:hypothetical protein